MTSSKNDLESYVKKVELDYKLALQREELRSIRFKRLQKMFATVLVVYMSAALLALVIIDPSKFFSPLFSKNNANNSELSAEIDSLETKVASLEKTLNTFDDSDKSSAILSSRIVSLEATQNALSETIVESPEKALTSKLLREQQISLKDDLQRLEQQSKSTSEKVDSFVSSLLTVPIVGFFVTLLIGLATFFVSNLRTKRDKTQS